jgi:hypothetical protein
LEVQESASPTQIKQAYRALAKKYHPDKSSSEHASLLFTQINEAYEVLSDPAQKMKYDRKDVYPRQAVQPNQYRRRPRPAASYNARPAKDPDLVLKPYVRYFRMVSIVGLVLSSWLLIDYILPRTVIEDHVVRIENVIGASRTGRRFVKAKKVTTERVIFEIDNTEGIHLFQQQEIEIRRTVGLGIVTSIDFLSSEAMQRYSLAASVYGNFSFAWIILLITSSLGIYIKKPAEMILNFAIVNGILAILVLYFTIIS